MTQAPSTRTTGVNPWLLIAPGAIFLVLGLVNLIREPGDAPAPLWAIVAFMVAGALLLVAGINKLRSQT